MQHFTIGINQFQLDLSNFISYFAWLQLHSNDSLHVVLLARITIRYISWLFPAFGIRCHVRTRCRKMLSRNSHTLRMTFKDDSTTKIPQCKVSMICMFDKRITNIEILAMWVMTYFRKNWIASILSHFKSMNKIW